MHGLAQLLRNFHRVFQPAIFKQHREFVAADARQGIAFADFLTQLMRDLAQQFVAGIMAAGIVNDLKLIKIYKEQRMHFSVLLRAQQRALQAILKLAAIDQAGEHIVACLIGYLRRCMIDFFLQVFLRSLERLRH